MIIGRIILMVWDVLPLGMLLLKGQNGQTWKDHMCNCALCHLSHVNGQVDPSLVVVLVGLCCMLCGQFTRVATMLICDWCPKVAIWDVLCHH